MLTGKFDYEWHRENVASIGRTQRPARITGSKTDSMIGAEYDQGFIEEFNILQLCNEITNHFIDKADLQQVTLIPALHGPFIVFPNFIVQSGDLRRIKNVSLAGWMVFPWIMRQQDVHEI